eukprot:TRINITY_DN1955_c0_g1_i10.p1 TRINITY_DN1955_c0_g1~~TRINITY_DN1955_c0_g1_i10.p1  ORF type:complete len:296 (-),score=69.53 TRINITY_DN1955_c0_g1_i10:128-916(-)
MASPPTIFEFEIDAYNGVVVDRSDKQLLELDELQFGRLLKSSLEQWQKDDRRGVWLKIPTSKSSFLPVAVEMGFEFKDCTKDHVLLAKWLPYSTNRLPLGPTHYVGVGGFVVNDKKEILVVREKHGPVTHIWKLPGGSVDPGENIISAAIREVLEETGIETEFISILSLRQNHFAMLGRSDIYFTCLLKPLTMKIKIQEEEISDCMWMPLEEFNNLGYYQGLYKKIMEIGSLAQDGGYNGFIGRTYPSTWRKGNEFLFHSNL